MKGAGFGVQGSGLKAQGSGFRVQGSGFRVQEIRVQGFGREDARVHTLQTDVILDDDSAQCRRRSGCDSPARVRV